MHGSITSQLATRGVTLPQGRNVAMPWAHLVKLEGVPLVVLGAEHMHLALLAHLEGQGGGIGAP